MAKLTTAERNRRKRERKKKEREDQRKAEEAALEARKEAEAKKSSRNDEDVEIEYVAETIVPSSSSSDELADMGNVLQKFQQRSTIAVVTEDEGVGVDGNKLAEADADGSDEDAQEVSKRKLREKLRPTVAELKRRVKRADLVEAHDVTATDPDFLLELKSAQGTVPVPRHWGRKRKYLQGKRGFEKPPFQLPQFIRDTGIGEVRDTLGDDERTARQRNRERVNPKMGSLDVDYRTLYDAFFKHQLKPTGLTKLGDLYFEGKELEMRNTVKPGGPLSDKLRQALGMINPTSPPPWLLQMQRYGPPPSYPALKIPGLNAPLPSTECQYGYHPGGWGKPPVDQYGRPLYGGNPFGNPGENGVSNIPKEGLVTSDGKTVHEQAWGALPMAGDMDGEEGDSEDEESSDDEMEESEEEEEEEGEEKDGLQSVVPTLPSGGPQPAALRKTGLETPLPAGTADDGQPKQLYTVLETTKGAGAGGGVFGSEVAYVMPGAAPEGAESVLAKGAIMTDEKIDKQRKLATAEDDEDDDIGKNFKF